MQHSSNKSVTASIPGEQRIRLTTQCVGFARNYLEINLGLSFSQVDLASDIWNQINSYRCLSDGCQLEVINRRNGDCYLPEPGELIIYNKKHQGTGHVAVVTHVNAADNNIYVAEQNYMSNYQAPEHRRLISFIQRGNKYDLQESGILGWKHINGQLD